MEGLIILLLLIILVLVVTTKSAMSERLSSLEAEMRRLQEIMQKRPLQKEEATTKEPEIKPAPTPAAPKAPAQSEWQSGFKVMPEESKPKEKPLAEQLEELLKTEGAEAEKSPPPVVEVKVTETIEVKTSTPVEATPPSPTFFERNPDLEKFIGENLVSKIGIGILVLAIAFFVKYAIDNNWIGEIGRVAIGIVCGGILVALAHKLRNSYAAFSSVLVGGGLAVFYFTIALAYHQFHLFSQSTAFIIMVVITAFAVALSLLYNRQEVAVIAMVGGFLTPFMVSDGSGNYKTLFIYLIILNAGLLIIAYNKTWRILNTLAFIFTVLLFGGWLVSLSFNTQPQVYKNGFFFATIFYLLFFAINIANNIKENKRFVSSDFSILLANTALYFSAGLYCIYQMQAEDYKGLFSACMAVFNLGASYLLFRNRKTDINILYLLIGVTLTFVSLTAPLQLKGNYITLFWASEAVLLYWLYSVSRITLFRLSSFLIYVSMIISLIMDWNNIYFSSSQVITVVLNKGFITTLYAAIASFVFYVLVNKEEKSTQQKEDKISHGVLIASVSLLYLAGAFEVYFQFDKRMPGGLMNIQYIQLYTFLFVAAFILVAKNLVAIIYSRPLNVVLCVVSIVLFFILAPTSYANQADVLMSGKAGSSFLVPQIVSAVALGFLFAYIMNGMRSAMSANSNTAFYPWLLVIAIVAFLSIEASLLTRQIFYSETLPLHEINRVFGKTGLPILWGICSFVLMWLGMKYKYRTLRIISLTLFSVTLFKLFVFDIRNIPVAGKIAAFFFLGVLLLIVSFMYQRLKKIIIEDEKPAV